MNPRNNDRKTVESRRKAERTFYFRKAAERRRKQNKIKNNQKKRLFRVFFPFGSLFIMVYPAVFLHCGGSLLPPVVCLIAQQWVTIPQ